MNPNLTPPFVMAHHYILCMGGQSAAVGLAMAKLLLLVVGGILLLAVLGGALLFALSFMEWHRACHRKDQDDRSPDHQD